MFDTFQGLPVHELIVHATVVLVPTTALAVALAAVYPRFRAWVGPIPPILGVASVLLTQVTTMSGQKFYDRWAKLGPVSAAIQHHRQLGRTLIWFVIPLAIISIVAYVLERRAGASRTVVVIVAVLAVVSAGAVLVDVALIGHAGASASWKDFVNSTNPK
ncbi:MAG: hypothetical protein JWR52_795 [Marmoricola sp.]|nr:hypothetical protein [Marmoricola sp.]